MLWRLQILCRPTSDKPSFGASFESASSQAMRYNSDRLIFFFGFMEEFTSAFEKPGGCPAARHLSGSRVMNTGAVTVGGRVLRSPFSARSLRPAFGGKRRATCGYDGLNLIAHGLGAIELTGERGELKRQKASSDARCEGVEPGFSILDPETDYARQGDKILARQTIILAVQFQGHSIAGKAWENPRGHGIVEGRKTDGRERFGPHFGRLKDGEILQVHIAIGDQPGKHRASEQDVEVRGRVGGQRTQGARHPLDRSVVFCR